MLGNETKDVLESSESNELTNVETETKDVLEANVDKVNNVVYRSINSPEKLNKLTTINEMLNLTNSKHNKLVFVYSVPKVGSTSIVSSLRIFGINKIDIIHIHDEKMLNVLAHISDVTINDLILFNKYLGKDVYVINIYRSPIERKISTFFEKIGSHHFNNYDNEVNKYNITKVIERFNNIFPYIGTGDHFIDKYDIKIPTNFDTNNKYLLVNDSGIKYISLRLKDSNEWGRILTNILGFKIMIVKDYESSNKPIKDLYNAFKSSYKIPINLLNDEINSKYLKFYYLEDEIKNYYNEWLIKSIDTKNSYTREQFELYEKITIENLHIDTIQLDHYFDEGCICQACSIKRIETMSKLLRGINVSDKIFHSYAKNELIQKKVTRANKINGIIAKLSKIPRGKDFNRYMTTIVSNGKRLKKCPAMG